MTQRMTHHSKRHNVISKVNALIDLQLIENEEDEEPEVEANALNEILKIHNSEIKKNDR